MDFYAQKGGTAFLLTVDELVNTSLHRFKAQNQKVAMMKMLTF